MDTTDTTARMGTVLQAGGTWVLRYERTLAHPPAKVWSALTESEHLQHWLPCDIRGERRAGAALELPFWPAFVDRYGITEPVLTGRIEVWQPPEVFEWWWDGDRLRWELAPDAAGTRLTFTTWIARWRGGCRLRGRLPRVPRPPRGPARHRPRGAPRGPPRRAAGAVRGRAPPPPEPQGRDVRARRGRRACRACRSRSGPGRVVRRGGSTGGPRRCRTARRWRPPSRACAPSGSRRRPLRRSRRW